MTPSPFADIIRSARKRSLWNPAATTCETAYGRAEIERLLPHRGSALMLDTITGVDLTQRSIRATRCLGADDRGFAGHFPGAPVYPAFLQFEIAGQAGVCLLDFLRRESIEIPPGLLPRSVRPIKVHHGVLLSEIHPGDSLTAVATVLEDDELTSIFAGQLLKGEIVCSTAIVEVCFIDE